MKMRGRFIDSDGGAVVVKVVFDSACMTNQPSNEYEKKPHGSSVQYGRYGLNWS